MDLFDARFAAYLAVATLLIMTPGPDMALVTRNALRSGRRAASFTAVGVGLGTLGWAIASTVGIGVLLERSAIAFTVLKLAGAVYLGYLGLKSLRSSFGHDAPIPAHETTPAIHSWQALRQGLLGNLLNPKAGVIFVSILPQFVRPGDSPLRLLLMLLAFEGVLLVWLNLYGYLICRAGASRGGVRVRRMVERLTGAVLIGLGLRLAIERR